MSLKDFSIQLYKIGAIKFGQFKTKVGIMTPVYCDLRVIVSYPEVMKRLADLLAAQIKTLNNIDVLCGVPYTALPIATAVSLETGLPMVMRRKEAKDYGTKKLIEGVFKDGDKCLIVEDVVTSGSSILETVRDLQNEGLKCKEAIVLLNREQGGFKILESKGIKMHSLLKLTELIDYLIEANLISKDEREKLDKYLAENQLNESILNKAPAVDRLKLSFESRSKQAKNPIASKLFQIMATKKTNLCLAVDVTDSAILLNLAEQVGPYICALKTHIDILEDFHENLIAPLKEIAERHDFVLFEDRKFADIGNTVQQQYSKGIYKIGTWASLVTAHSLMGKGVLDALKGAPGLPERGIFLLAETSASNSLITEQYTKATLKLASEYPDLIAGIVCQNPLFLDQPGLIQLTPGVKIEEKKDSLGQQYNSPEAVVVGQGADVAVVGRGIIEAKDPVVAAKMYRDLLWQAVSKRVEA
ncbi:uridine 5'-monophosphate synthase [Anthonomus grandis grandis]|uniref:uridine 5'-monophosphate synthase n=1 Tax=Anthonomus grandis grandis TaxID=2921223 RepID=UPI00216506FE|nr:uridine 5'-monophosphate synthase [Anthonomus grandis grandis]XP_050293884.1 uridine 5'-monophosphate synthase [Anthonomus grandis grandis]